jgi:hypothetical protein
MAYTETTSDLLGKDVNTIGEHILNIYKEVELKELSTTRKFKVVQKEGQRFVERNLITNLLS